MDKDASATVGKTPCDVCHRISTGVGHNGGYYCDLHMPTAPQATDGVKEASKAPEPISVKEAGVRIGSC